MKDGTVVTYLGEKDYGGDGNVKAASREVDKINSSSWAFAAVVKDMTVVT